jgi:hypothetical protein
VPTKIAVSIAAIFSRMLAAMWTGPTAGLRCLSGWFALFERERKMLKEVAISSSAHRPHFDSDR